MTPDTDPSVGDNINGPSLIRVPDWIRNPIGRYYLYFASHSGDRIRLAYSDNVEGPYTVYAPGALRLDQTQHLWHIASPDVHINESLQLFVMYYHGPVEDGPDPQATSVAVSEDGVNFTDRSHDLGLPYWRVFEWDGYFYALVMPGIFVRSRGPFGPFEEGPTLYTADMRHSAALLRGSTLHVFHSNAHDCPEHILRSTIDLEGDWEDWEASEPKSLLEPEEDWEGEGEMLLASERGAVTGPVRQLRDPAIFEEGAKTWLLYSVAGESGLAIAKLTV
ncbi:MAG: hypothetical protein HQ559_03300 [Lentisphaerae bacterium]|nr:hypothetical protein [Lentisphaerota bacterium]